jgi:hypothetical protein
LGFLETKDGNQNARWPLSKEYNRGGNSISSSTQDDLSFFLSFMFCLHLCVYLRAYILCYGIFKGDLGIA